MNTIHKNNYKEHTIYLADTPMHKSSEERQQFVRMTDSTNLGHEFLDYVASLIKALESEVFVTPEQLIVNHMCEIGAAYDAPDKAIEFVTTVARSNLLPLTFIGTDLYRNDVYRVDRPYSTI